MTTFVLATFSTFSIGRQEALKWPLNGTFNTNSMDCHLQEKASFFWLLIK